ncbi:MAG: ATP-binding protein, partial [Verrucomicrobiota bacterium]
MPQSLRVLLVEDNPEDAKLVLHELNRSGFETTSQRVDTEAAFLAGLDGGLDLILCDYTMPEFSGPRALELLKKRGLEIPLIIVSGTIGEEIAVEAMKLGAADYLFKDRLARLGPSVRQALEKVRLRKEHRQLAEELIEAQKMEVIGKLAGGVAHDFNNLLAVIMGYSDLMMGKLEADSPLQKDAQTIRHAAERAAGLTRQLLVFSRKQTVQPVVLDINEVVAEMEKMLGRLIDENVELIIALGPQVGRLKADSGYVGQVLMNLVVNARDAMENGGKITVRTDNVTLDHESARAHPGAAPGDYVMLGVTDTGTGMTDEVKARLFEAFFTTKPKGKGTGLGLATCQNIVQQCGGHIAVSSQLGKGTTFRVYFPRVEEAVKPSDTAFRK